MYLSTLFLDSSECLILIHKIKKRNDVIKEIIPRNVKIKTINDDSFHEYGKRIKHSIASTKQKTAIVNVVFS